MSRDIDEDMCNETGGYYVNGQCDICVGWSYYNSYYPLGSDVIVTTLQLWELIMMKIMNIIVIQEKSPHLNFMMYLQD